MATLHGTAAPALPAPPLVVWRAGRAWPALALAATVLSAHAWLVTLLAPVAPAAGAPQAPAMPSPTSLQVRSLPRQAVEAPAPVATPQQAPTTAARQSATAPAPRLANAPRLRPTARAGAEASPPPVAAAPMAVATADDEPAPTAAATPSATATTTTTTTTAATSTGTPPPLYATRLPAPAQLRYALRYNGREGAAVLAWQHDGAHYSLNLDGTEPDGEALLSQASTGALDHTGLAPERFVDRRRTGRQQAANVRRDIGRITYSGAAQLHPAWPGAQDRLSWLVQLLAVLAAAETPLAEVQLFVTDALGNAGIWMLQRQPDTTGPTPWGEQALAHWQREPPRPEGLRIDIWLVARPAAPAQAWPLRLRFVVPRSGDAFELVLPAAP